MCLGLFRSCAGPALQYALRCSEASIGAAQQHDEALAKLWSDLLGRPIPVDNPKLWLRLRMGGCGAASARSGATVAPWAAWCAAIGEVTAHMGLTCPEELLAQVPEVAEESPRIHARLSHEGTIPSITYASPARALTLKSSQEMLVTWITSNLSDRFAQP